MSTSVSRESGQAHSQTAHRADRAHDHRADFTPKNGNQVPRNEAMHEQLGEMSDKLNKVSEP
jgi:hypothetical protein